MTTTPAAVPAAIVSGRPTPSSRSGTAYPRRSARSLMRDASANSTRVRVTSATSFTSSLPIGTSRRPRTGPASSPVAVKNIAAVTLRASSRRDIAANPMRSAATVAIAQVMTGPPRPRRPCLRLREQPVAVRDHGLVSTTAMVVLLSGGRWTRC